MAQIESDWHYSTATSAELLYRCDCDPLTRPFALGRRWLVLPKLAVQRAPRVRERWFLRATAHQLCACASSMGAAGSAATDDTAMQCAELALCSIVANSKIASKKQDKMEGHARVLILKQHVQTAENAH